MKTVKENKMHNLWNWLQQDAELAIGLDSFKTTLELFVERGLSVSMSQDSGIDLHSQC